MSPGAREAERESRNRSECSERSGPCGVWDEQQLESAAEQRGDCIWHQSCETETSLCISISKSL